MRPISLTAVGLLLIIGLQLVVRAAPTVSLAEGDDFQPWAQQTASAPQRDCVPADYRHGITMMWYAPFYSRSGYGSEATEIMKGLDQLAFNRSCTRDGKVRGADEEGDPVQGGHGGSRLEVTKAFAVNHGDGIDSDAVKGWSHNRTKLLNRVTLDAFTSRLVLEESTGSPSQLRSGPDGKKNTNRGEPYPLVVVCHSEPGAWSLPRAKFDTTPCPPVTSRGDAVLYGEASDDEDEEQMLERILEGDEESELESPIDDDDDDKLESKLKPYRPDLVVGRTMFETDRLPLGWKETLLRLDDIWVPTQFHFNVFHTKSNGKQFGGIPKSRLFVFPEAIDAENEWNPEKVHPLVNVTIPRVFAVATKSESVVLPSKQTTTSAVQLVDDRKVYFDFTKAIKRFKPTTFLLSPEIQQLQGSGTRPKKQITMIQKRTEKMARRQAHINAYSGKGSGSGPMRVAEGKATPGGTQEDHEAVYKIERENQLKKEEAEKTEMATFFEDRCRFKFLSVFKWEHRKGWDVLLSAFYEEFSGWVDPKAQEGASRGKEEEPVCLILKTSGYHSEIDDGDDTEYEAQVSGYLREKYGVKQWNLRNDPKILLLSSHVPQASYPGLYRSIDSLVQPSRGEGWGRPHQEAMAMGIPVIATNWSGNTAFMRHAENSLLIDLDRIPITEEEDDVAPPGTQHSHPPPRTNGKLERIERAKNAEGLRRITGGAFKGHFWAEPSVTSLREQMRRVVSEKMIPERESSFLETISQTARQEMLDRYSPVAVARMATDRIEALVKRKTEKKKKKKKI